MRDFKKHVAVFVWACYVTHTILTAWNSPKGFFKALASVVLQ